MSILASFNLFLKIFLRYLHWNAPRMPLFYEMHPHKTMPPEWLSSLTKAFPRSRVDRSAETRQNENILKIRFSLFISMGFVFVWFSRFVVCLLVCQRTMLVDILYAKSIQRENMSKILKMPFSVYLDGTGMLACVCQPSFVKFSSDSFH